MNTLNRQIIIKNNSLLIEYIGDRSLRAYRYPVDGRLGMNGLTKLVKKVTGEGPKHDHAYLFYVKNRELVKVLMKDEISTNLMELYDGHVGNVKALCAELELM